MSDAYLRNSLTGKTPSLTRWETRFESVSVVLYSILTSSHCVEWGGSIVGRDNQLIVARE